MEKDTGKLREMFEVVKTGVKIPLFDVDWTLIQGGNKAHGEALNYALSRIFHITNASINVVEEINGMVDTQILIEALKFYNVLRDEARHKMPEALQAANEYFKRHKDEGKSALMPGAWEILSYLQKKHVPIGLLTGNIEKIAWQKLELSGFKKSLFNFGAFGDMAEKRVDLVPIARERISSKLGMDVPLGQLVIVGDTPKDIYCAKESGIEAIGVAAGKYTPGQLSLAGANLVVNSLREQKKILSFLNVSS